MFKSKFKYLIVMLCFSVLLLGGTLIFCSKTQNLGGKVSVTYDPPKDFLTYQLNTSKTGWIVTGYNESKRKGRTAIEIPDNYTQNNQTLPVTEIKQSAFSGKTIFTSLTIGNNVQSIRGSAFYNCSALIGTLTIPDSVTVIEASAFNGCSGFTSLKIGKNVTNISSSAFRNCSGLTGELIIPEGVKWISGYAFADCKKISSLTISPGIVQIYDYAFLNCKLTRIDYTGTLKQWCEQTTSGIFELFSPSPSLRIQGKWISGELIIDDDISRINDAAFRRLNITSVTIGQSVTSIGARAFNDTSLTGQLIIPNKVTTIGDNAFGGCSKLSGPLTIPDSVISIGKNAFDSYKITDLKIGAQLSSIGDSAFNYKNHPTSIFVDKNNEKYTSRDEDNETECNVLVDKTTKKLILGSNTFNIPKNITIIGSNAFYSCNDLISVEIWKGITTIESYAFAWCKGLTKVKIGADVKSISSNGFINCSLLNEVIIDSPTIYSAVSSTASSNGYLTNYIQSNGTIKVLQSADDGSNTYLTDTTKFTMSTTKIDGSDYNVYTKI